MKDGISVSIASIGRYRWHVMLVTAVAALSALAIVTVVQLAPLPGTLDPDPGGLRKVQVRDRGGSPLTITYNNDWNYHDRVPLHAVPGVLKEAFVFSEDQRFWEHGGVDWKARIHAVWQNLKAGRSVRGASTITEQVVRMLHPRPRTLWSRWLEGWDARRLEQRFSKGEILSFYLNQVPYAGNRRGVAQAARYYFGRDLDTLSEAEMLALAVAVRAPARFGPRGEIKALRRRIEQLAERMERDGLLEPRQLMAIREASLVPGEQDLEVSAEHFVRWLTERPELSEFRDAALTTTLDGGLQNLAQSILATRLADLAQRNVSAGALLVADHQSGDILAWISGRADADRSGDEAIDTVLAPRQPGSALKPFVYALALEDGWTAATLLNDAPLASPVGTGQHAYRNYSRRHYGPLRLRDCLGNSLNIPAVLAAKQIGPERLLDFLRRSGFTSLDRDAQTYGLGLALGNGEVSLYEMVEAYAALARGGVYRPLRALLSEERSPGRRIMSEGTATVIADILADPSARELEFGRGSILNLPHPVAVKTGTSTDYRDAWAVGFDHRFVVGVWLGNLDATSMNSVTGATGPAMVLRGVFAELARRVEPRPLPVSPRLIQKAICLEKGRIAGPDCPTRLEWFDPDHLPGPCETAHAEQGETGSAATIRGSYDLRLVQPSEGLLLALDPRIPDELEYFSFELPEGLKPHRTQWLVDGAVAAVTGPGVTKWLWPVKAGRHTAAAHIWVESEGEGKVTESSTFRVRGRSETDQRQ